MKTTIRNILCTVVCVAAGISSSSCTDYLDRSEDTIVSADMFYKNFYNFQGFTEELYYCIQLFFLAV